MQLDIRIPIGLLFVVIGAVLASFGLATDSVIYETHSLGHNINLGWGLILLVFGGVMLALAYRSRRTKGR
jgi:hypothetical protein